MTTYKYDIYDSCDWEMYEYTVENEHELYNLLYERYLSWFEWALSLANDEAQENGYSKRTETPIGYEDFCKQLNNTDEMIDTFYTEFLIRKGA